MIAELDGDRPDHDAVPPRSQVPAQRAPTSPQAKVERVRTEPAWTEPDEPRTFGPDDDPSVLGDSSGRAGLRSRYGEFRPPVPIGRRRRAGTMTGTARRAQPDRPERLDPPLLEPHRLPPVQLAVRGALRPILAQAVIGLLTAAATP